MPTQKQKTALIDRYNLAFSNILDKQIQDDYKRFYNNAIIKATAGDKTPKERREAIKETAIRTSNFKRYAYVALALSGITNIIENQRIPNEDKKHFMPLVGVLAMYGVNNVELVTRKTELMVSKVLGLDVELNKRDKVVLKQYQKYFTVNRDIVKKTIEDAEKHINRINKQIKSNLTKDVQQQIKGQLKLRVTEVVDGKEVTRPKTFQEIRADLRAKYDEQVGWRIERVVKTEVHRLQEQAKQVQHLALGYTHKKWNTQQDTKVRDTHEAMHGEIVKIDNKFRLPSDKNCQGGWAMFPGDPSLPACQSINCRCFLTYVKRLAI